MGEGVVELILLAEDIAGAQSHAPIDALDGRIRPSAEGMGSAEKAVGVCEVTACLVAYSRTSSARARTDGAMVRPRAFAVFMLMTSSNLVACSTGKSAGRAPLRILSTKTAPRW